MDVWLGHEDVALGGTGGQQLRRGLYDLAAGLELGIIGEGGKSAPTVLASRAHGHRTRKTDSAVENRTNGEESEKACTVDVQASRVAARESCMVA
jgi:hypothetical protein